MNGRELHPMSSIHPIAADTPGPTSASEPSAAAGSGPDLPPLLDRELSWLEFVGRVLAIAEDASLPVLERVKFLAISSQNLDHFFQVRVPGLKAQVAARLARNASDGPSADQPLRAIRPRVLELMQRQDDLFLKELRPALDQAGVYLRSWDEMSEADRQTAVALFEAKIFPALTPLAVDPAHPFPYISNLSLNLALLVCRPGSESPRFARVKVPALFPRLVPLSDQQFLPVEQLIEHQIERLFPGMEIMSCVPFRVTRDADLAIEEEDAEDLLIAIESGLRRRQRRNAATRLEMPARAPERIRALLADELELGDRDLFLSRSMLDLGSLWELHRIARPDLKQVPMLPCAPPRLARRSREAGAGIFEALREGDVLLHHPYESFSASVEAFMTEAARDPRVLAIKHTLYRTSGPESPIVRALINAAEAGKQVVTLVELKARFDEEANIEWARALEEAGVHVVYGVVGLKAHGKITLVVRNEPQGIRRYAHVGTGNYNPQTAQAYEDVGLLSCDEQLCADLTDVFNYLTGYSRQQRFRKLLVAPMTLRAKLLGMIESEGAQRDGRIVIKANSLEDPELIHALYRASQAGVKIDLIVRGVCALRPGVKGVSENIRVRSIVGRFLEHSRIFRFGSDARGARYFIGSADLMTRNLDGRLEVVAPVEDALLVERLQEILDANLADDRLAWELEPDGRWRRVPTTRGFEVQEHLIELARRRSGADPTQA
ncbi:MAG TPA: polyphosphate kinase 1 [Myxococcota bacterium]|nr:polyphosphate kinase 1 [Myxococcota bacterium]